MEPITQKTAERIWNCHREIEVGEKLIADLEKHLSEGTDPTPLDSWGRRQQYSLGCPSGETSKTLYRVEPKLALSIIRAHVANAQAELIEATEQARIEMDHKF